MQIAHQLPSHTFLMPASALRAQKKRPRIAWIHELISLLQETKKQDSDPTKKKRQTQQHIITHHDTEHKNTLVVEK